MTQLIDVHYFHLTPYVLRMLHQNRIETVVQLLSASDRSLGKAANLDAQTVTEIRQYLLENYGPMITSGLAFKDKAISRTFLLQTGIEGLDALLPTGILSGSLVELSGHVAVGKSILLTTIALNAARHQHIRALFISTKRSFSGFRIYQILKEWGSGQKDCGEIMHRMRYEEVTDGSGLIGVLNELLNNGHNYDYQLLVVDSLAPLLFPYQRDQRKKGISIITEAMVLMRHIAERHHKIIFIESVVLSGSEQSIKRNHRQTNLTSSISQNWPSAPSLRLHLSNAEQSDPTLLDIPTKPQSDSRRIQLLKSTQHASGGSCIVRLTTRGIV